MAAIFNTWNGSLHDLKKQISEKRNTLVVHLQDKAGKEKNHTVNLCNQLTRFFEIPFEYQKATSKIFIKKLPVWLEHFICGHWMERYVAQLLVDHLVEEQNPGSLQYVLNVYVLLGRGRFVELDLIFCWARRLFRLETKTGNWSDALHQMELKARWLGLHDLPTTLVVPHASDRLAQECEKRFGIEVVALAEFEGRYLRPLKRRFGPFLPPGKPR